MTGSRPAATFREATLDDVPAVRRILAAHGNDGPVTAIDIVGPYVRHLVTAPHARALVAVVDGSVVAYGASIDAGVAVHLADLFVAPDRLGQGIGRPLLDAVLDGSSRRTTFASDDPRALPLYVRARMRPRWPNLFVEGEAARLPAPPASLAVEAAAAARLAGLEEAWTGAARLADHRHWASLPDASPFVVVEDGEPVALGHARSRQSMPGRMLDRMIVREGADAGACLLAALRWAGRGGRVSLGLPGPHPALPALFDAAFRLVERDEFMASDAGIVDPERRISDGGML